MIRVGVIGVGSMGQNHVRVLFHSEEAKLVAVADAHEEALRKVAEKYKVTGYADYKEMLLREDLDAVTIAVPTSLLKEVALAALSQGKHVLLEKPIAASEEDGKEIIKAAEEQKVTLMIGHIERFNPAIAELKRRLLLGQLGDIYKIDVQRIGPFPHRVTDVGVIIDLSVHDLDIISYLTGAEPIHLYAEKQQRLHPTQEDLVTALVKYDNGMLAVLNINYLSPTKIRQLQIFGKKGMFSVDYLNQELYFYENTSFSSDTWESVTEGEMKKIIIPKKEPLVAELQEFLSCIREKRAPLVTGGEALKIVSIANSLLHATHEQKIVRFDSHEKN